MNNEQQELLDEAYMFCMSQNGFKYENELLVGKMGGLNHNVTYWLTKEEFINKCKTDSEFSEKWGLKIEERELIDKERIELAGGRIQDKYPALVEMSLRVCDERDILTKLITVTYNDQIIESYE
jgi:hypothetical protein